jgi:hypothetical protein
MGKLQRTATALASLSSSTFTIVLMSYGTVVPGWLRSAMGGRGSNSAAGGGGAGGRSAAPAAVGLRRYLPDGEVRVDTERRHPANATQRTGEEEELGGGIGVDPPPLPASSSVADDPLSGADPGAGTVPRHRGSNGTASLFAWDPDDWHRKRCYYVENVCRTSHRWFYRDDDEGDSGNVDVDGNGNEGPTQSTQRKRKHQPDLVWATARPGERPPNGETVYKRYYRIQRLGGGRSGGNAAATTTTAFARGLLDSCTTSAVTNHVRDQLEAPTGRQTLSYPVLSVLFSLLFGSAAVCA